MKKTAIPLRWLPVALGALLGAEIGRAAPAVPTITSAQAEAWDREIAASGVNYTLSSSSATFVVPNASFPASVSFELSNNCVGLGSFNDVLFLGFRTAPFHFASNLTRIYIVSSVDGGVHWDEEAVVELHSDAREPHFLLMPDNTFVFSFFQAGTDPLAFEPVTPWRMYYQGPRKWSAPEKWGQAHEVPWQLGVFNGTAFATSYEGSHYSILNRPDVYVFFNQSTDGRTWTPLNATRPGPNGTTVGGHVYEGGVSEVGWEFSLDGTFWAVMRNEDGDTSGWGSRIARAQAGTLGRWDLFPRNQSNENIYESPRMFRHGDELFLVARRDNAGVYWNHSWDGLPWEVEHDLILAEYSLRPHRTSVWHLNRGDPDHGVDPVLEYLFDIPGCGDTAFPSILRIGKHTYLVANYTNPPALCPNWPWIEGQLSPSGSQIYFVTFTFTPAPSA